MLTSLIIINVVLLVIATSIVPQRSQLSEFELGRRLDEKLPGALLEWRRGEVYIEMMTVRRIAVAFLLVLASALIIAKTGWLWGVLLAFTLTLLYNRLATIPPLRLLIHRYYMKYETPILKFVDRHRGLIGFFRGVADSPMALHVSSREEVEHVIDQLDILTDKERKTIKSTLHFDTKLIKDFMTPRSVMETIGVHELLGPLVLDSLHKTGHKHFPVFEGDIDHMVGMLHIHTLFSLTDKHTRTVREVMEPRVLYIREDQTLSQALTACIKHRRHLLVVINEYRETVGVITIEDAAEQLIGYKLVDEYESHDDLRAVAARNPRANNKSAKSLDV